MIAIGQLIQVAKEKYFFLKMLSWRNDLLKYFTLDKGEFMPSNVPEIEDEFVKKFRGDSPTIRDIVNGNLNISCEEYQERLFSTCFKNYISSLEGAIKFAEKMN